MEEGAKAAKRRWWRAFSNPMLAKELRGRMRGARAFVVLTVYLLLLGCFATLIYYFYKLAAGDAGGASSMAYVGKVLFSSVVLIELFMVTFITPAFAAGAISGEKERQTYEVLRTTLLPARKLVFGKLWAALVYILLLVLAAVPLESLAFVLGGVVLEELLLALVFLLVTAFFFATLGVFFSSIMRTTLVATVLSYATALLTMVGLPAVQLIFAFFGVAMTSLFSPSSWIGQMVMSYVLILVVSLSPLTATVATEVLLLEQDAVLYYWQSITTGRAPISGFPVPSPWIIYTGFYMGLACLMLLVSVLRVRQQARV